jgi:Zn-dependent protease
MISYQFFDLLAQIAIMLPAFLVSLSWHEFFHAYVATILGDDTPKKAGRLTLNPIAHIDFLGLLCLLLFRIGWAKPVTFDHRNFKYPKLYAILTALAGPLSNFLLALVILYGMTYLPYCGFPPNVTITFVQIGEVTAYVNIMLGIFNLLPIPPLDGSHVLMVFLIDRWPRLAFFIYQYALFILIIIFLLPQTRILLTHLIEYTESLLHTLII